jgi:integrase
VHIRSTLKEMADGTFIIGPPKTAAGRRPIAVAPALIDGLHQHLAEFVGDDAGGLVFAGPKGAPLRRSNFQKQWTRAVSPAGLADRGLHFHDLRHTGNTLTAQSWATLADLAVAVALDRFLPPKASGT